MKRYGKNQRPRESGNQCCLPEGETRSLPRSCARMIWTWQIFRTPKFQCPGEIVEPFVRVFQSHLDDMQCGSIGIDNGLPMVICWTRGFLSCAHRYSAVISSGSWIQWLSVEDENFVHLCRAVGELHRRLEPLRCKRVWH